MSTKSTLVTFTLGAVAGVIVISGLAVGNDWVVTAKVNEQNVKEASINAKADVCVAMVRDHLAEQGKDPKLEGYTPDARDNRRRLAKRFAAPLVAEGEPSDEVIRACSEQLS